MNEQGPNAPLQHVATISGEGFTNDRAEQVFRSAAPPPGAGRMSDSAARTGAAGTYPPHQRR
ncbi:hypothetical protein [Amycolatopsis sp. 195334CR]|uniref:hypothetical protein n=1 Tax=Amycolatopsis sp. 195334CR TaxID=2814588 RepID=UPI001A8C2975|nr:hypothetical protein [Amycolatopsis sp. 195334CR]MBN6040625.1 hypothetical protein [Amycolatopsis sp. 195334CR]